MDVPNAAVTVFAVCDFALHVFQWRLYLLMRIERNGWRNVAQRALLVARLGHRVGKRAEAVARKALA